MNIPRTASEPLAISKEDFEHLVERASAGSEEAVDELRRVLRANSAIYRALGDVAQHVQLSLITLFAKEAVVAGEAMRLRLDEKRSELLQAGDSPLEKLLVEQVLASELDLQFCRIGYANDHETEAAVKRREQRLHRAHERYMAAIRMLCEVRRTAATQ